MKQTDVKSLEAAIATLEAEELILKTNDLRCASFCAGGQWYSYASTFWERVGLITYVGVNEKGQREWRDLAVTPEQVALVRASAVALWVAAGAPLEWAQHEIDDTLTNQQFVDIGEPWVTD